MSMPQYEISGDRIIVVKPHPQGGTTHRELDPSELQLVELAKQLSGCTARATREQHARFAIDSQIKSGRQGINPPPADSWLYEYWQIGQRLAELTPTERASAGLEDKQALSNPLDDLAALDVYYKSEDVIDGLVEFHKVSRIIMDYMRSTNQYYKIRIGHFCSEALAAEAKAASAARDAARYRWLCANNFGKPGVTQVHTWVHSWEPHSQTGEPTEWKQRVRGGGALDAVIDREMMVAVD